ncbi:hypothetical protein BKA67DRAFT_537165 [Truncatella angustata]|uniref:Uncharacterized protein n=1 Tax=Truncatella angustata TaxID=152316 RepID=A0A9P8UJX7_9PEZI|nr:uncharacterized protein BKA67DRAFT_537165 [Truncatella angustata]KAH6653497.1 hypothetical protein BKA67DRAFT_537165 [Truncatella angustata]
MAALRRSQRLSKKVNTQEVVNQQSGKPLVAQIDKKPGILPKKRVRLARRSRAPANTQMIERRQVMRQHASTTPREVTADGRLSDYSGDERDLDGLSDRTIHVATTINQPNGTKCGNQNQMCCTVSNDEDSGLIRTFRGFEHDGSPETGLDDEVTEWLLEIDQVLG